MAIFIIINHSSIDLLWYNNTNDNNNDTWSTITITIQHTYECYNDNSNYTTSSFGLWYQLWYNKLLFKSSFSDGDGSVIFHLLIQHFDRRGLVYSPSNNMLHNNDDLTLILHLSYHMMMMMIVSLLLFVQYRYIRQ